MTEEDDAKCKALAESLTNFVNGATSEEIATFAMHLTNQHRTLQQRVFSAFLCFAQNLDANYKAGFYDARNEQSCKLAGILMKETDGYWGLRNI